VRILHVGFGFRPWIVNGLVIYSEAIMEGQVGQGHDVAYFFAARQLPFVRRSFLHRWERRGVQMFEWVNSRLITGRHRGTPEPERELEHAATEQAFGRALERFGPDVVHVHDLGGLPSSILDITRLRGIATVMTIHDYHPLCPTVKLYDAYDRVCLRRDPGAMCAVCCADSPDDNREDLARTVVYARQKVRRTIPALDAALGRPAAERAGVAGIRLMERAMGMRRTQPSAGAPGSQALVRGSRAPAAAYQRRRDLNLERLSRVDALIASSERSAAIYRELGVTAPIRVLPINPPHIEQLRPKQRREVGEPLRFVALNACNNSQKGSELIVGALSRLSERRLNHRYRLAVHGFVAPDARPALSAHPSVVLHPDYQVEELDRLLEDADIGLFPSVWEEVYGFVGLEFLAKGIPVIGNAVGAIPEYVWPGRTGWLNRSCSANELAELMAAAIENPGEVQRMGNTATALRDELISPFASGLAGLEVVYRDVVRRLAGSRQV
jgi:glycosyltransferase involved in cell wall biosynthesis